MMHSRLPSLLQRRFTLLSRRTAIQGYLAAIGSVAVITLLIAAVQRATHVENISLLYLLAVLWLATKFGRGPAILASVLAFLAYDFFFIPPLFHLTVGDSAQWLSLFALLVTALVIGQLTATAQKRTSDALESQRQSATLFALAQLTVSTSDQDSLLRALAARVVEIFGPVGIGACAIILSDARGWPIVRGIAPPEGELVDALNLETREQAAQARWVLERGSTVGAPIHLSDTVLQRGGYVAFYLALRSTRGIVGVLGIAGTPTVRRFATYAGTKTRNDTDEPQMALFGAFCDQIALTVERTALQQQAIHTEALRESNRLKDTLIGSVTHDLRTPLAAIQAAADGLRGTETLPNEATREELLETITTSSQRLNRLVSNLLDLSRLEAGVAAPEKQWYAINDVIATVLDRLDMAGRIGGRRIEVVMAEEAPLVPLDHAQIEQVLTNLLENALKYSPSESVIRLKVCVLEQQNLLEVSVADEGIGIPANELHAIFDKFYRVQHVRLPWTRERPPVGTGLGLAICANIIHAHGGQIWVESVPHAGATFFFTLPLPVERLKGTLPEIVTPPEEPVHASIPLANDTRGGEAEITI